METDPDSQEWQPPTRAEMKRAVEKLRNDKFFLPNECSLQDLHVLWLSCKADLPCHIPHRPATKDLVDSGFKMKADKRYETIGGEKLRGYPKLNRDAVELIVHEMVYQKFGLPLWCEDVVVDYEYILILLFLMDKRKYLSLMSDEISTRANTTVGYGLVTINKKIESRKKGIISNIFTTLKLEDQIKEQVDTVDKILSEVQRGCFAFANNNDFGETSEYGKIVMAWMKQIGELKRNTNVETPKSFLTARYNPGKLLVFTPEPLTSQIMSAAALKELDDLVQSINEPPTGVGIYDLIPHDFIFDERIDPNEPAELKRLKAVVKIAMVNGNQLTKEQVFELMGDYWAFCSESQTLIPSSSHRIFNIPTIPSSFIPKAVRDHLIRLAGENNKSAKLASVPRRRRKKGVVINASQTTQATQATQKATAEDVENASLEATAKNFYDVVESLLKPGKENTYIIYIKELLMRTGRLFVSEEDVLNSYKQVASDVVSSTFNSVQFTRLHRTLKQRKPVLDKAMKCITQIDTDPKVYRQVAYRTLAFFLSTAACVKRLFIFSRRLPEAQNQLTKEEAILLRMSRNLVDKERCVGGLANLKMLDLYFQYFRTEKEREDQDAKINRGEEEMDSNLDVNEQVIEETAGLSENKEVAEQQKLLVAFEDEVFGFLKSIEIISANRLSDILHEVSKNINSWADSAMWVLARSIKDYLIPELTIAMGTYYFSLRSMIIIYGLVLQIIGQCNMVFTIRINAGIFNFIDADKPAVLEIIRLLKTLADALDCRLGVDTTIANVISGVTVLENKLLNHLLPHDEFLQVYQRMVDSREFARKHVTTSDDKFFSDDYNMKWKELKDSVWFWEFKDHLKRGVGAWMFSDLDMSKEKARTFTVYSSMHGPAEIVSCYSEYQPETPTSMMESAGSVLSRIASGAKSIFYNS